ncbi:MAG: 2-oxoacid:acceptor oxidoreductase family protein [Adlercreutzia equolifaciens]
MIDILLAGVGGQGTVLAAKVLAQAAQNKGWQVRTAETIGMAARRQRDESRAHGLERRGGVLAAHHPGTADIVIALGPARRPRPAVSAPGGVLVTATTAIPPVTAALSSQPYRAGDVVAALANSLQARRPASKRPRSPLRRMPRPTPRTPKPPVWKATRCPCSSPWTTRPSCARPVPAPASPST